MRAEIDAILALVKEARANRAAIHALASRISARPPRAIVIAGRVTSDHAAIYARYVLKLVIGVPVSLAAPSLVSPHATAGLSPAESSMTRIRTRQAG